MKAASRLLRSQGPEGVSVDGLMEEAGLTRGGFYAHFRDKDALVADALDHAFGEQIDVLFRAGRGAKGRAKLEALADRYLAKSHVEEPERGCPAPALAADVARGSRTLKKVFRKNVGDLVDRLTKETGIDRKRALVLVSTWFGAILVARASGDPSLVTEIIEAAREAV